MNWDSRDDGVTHINVYSRGQTTLGRLLSNFASLPFTCPEFGTFASVEGYWYFLLTGNEELRELAGVEAKRVGKKSKPGEPPEFFEKCVRRALRLKVEAHPQLADLLGETTLPLAHYYVMKDWETGGRKTVSADSHPWVIDELEDIRSRLQGRELDEVEPETPVGESFSLF